jgi:hypothetical protein
MTEFLDLACLCYDDPHYDHRSFHRRAQEMLRGNPRLSEANIWCASAAGNPDAVKAFLDKQSALVSQPGPHGWVPLICACYSRVNPTLDVVKLLLDHGADPNACTMKGNADIRLDQAPRRFTALTGLFGGGSTGFVNQPPHPQWRELAELLLTRGASPADEQALAVNQDACLEILLRHGLQPDAVGSDGVSLMGRALSQAARRGNRDAVRRIGHTGGFRREPCGIRHCGIQHPPQCPALVMDMLNGPVGGGKIRKPSGVFPVGLGGGPSAGFSFWFGDSFIFKPVLATVRSYPAASFVSMWPFNPNLSVIRIPCLPHKRFQTDQRIVNSFGIVGARTTRVLRHAGSFANQPSALAVDGHSIRQTQLHRGHIAHKRLSGGLLRRGRRHHRRYRQPNRGPRHIAPAVMVQTVPLWSVSRRYFPDAARPRGRNPVLIRRRPFGVVHDDDFNRALRGFEL